MAYNIILWILYVNDCGHDIEEILKPKTYFVSRKKISS